MSKIIYILVFCLAITASSLQAKAPIIEKPPKPTDVKGLIAYHAKEYGVSAERMEKTMICESGLNPKSTNITSREHSVGIAQINLLAHKTITEAQARDIDFATEWTAKQFSMGNARIWTCYVKLYGRK